MHVFFYIRSPFQILSNSTFPLLCNVLYWLDWTHLGPWEILIWNIYLFSPQLFADPMPPTTRLPREAKTEETAGSFGGKTDTYGQKGSST